MEPCWPEERPQADPQDQDWSSKNVRSQASEVATAGTGGGLAEPTDLVLGTGRLAS